jgi:hypothetical protein
VCFAELGGDGGGGRGDWMWVRHTPHALVALPAWMQYTSARPLFAGWPSSAAPVFAPRRVLATFRPARRNVPPDLSYAQPGTALLRVRCFPIPVSWPPDHRSVGRECYG